jgi:hypothetical protein
MVKPMNHRLSPALIAVIPLLLVNTIAITGQADFWIHHLPGFPIIAGIAFACALESIAVFLAAYAHLASVSDDASLRLRLASYGMGIVIGILNASHFIVNGRLTAAAIGMGILSASSPALWGIFSRRQSRDKLRAAGLIESHALRLGTVRWLFHPGRSLQVFRYAAWDGLNNPAEAIAAWQALQDERAAITAAARQDAEQQEAAQEERMSLPDAKSRADAIRVALRDSGASTAPETARWLAARGWPGISAAYIRQVRSLDERNAIEQQRSSLRAVNGSPIPLALSGRTDR